MTTLERLATGFPVEVAIFEPERIKDRNSRSGDDLILSFTMSPDTTNDGIFCDAPGQRPGSIAWGISLEPVLKQPSADFSASALYVETTGPELKHFIECLQSLYDVNYDADGKLRDEE